MEKSDIQSKLYRLEARLRGLIESSAVKLLSPVDLKDGLALNLISAMQSGIKTRVDGEPIAPNLYTLSVHPVQSELLQSEPGLLEGLAETLHTTGVEEGFVFLRPPVLHLVEDPELSPHEIRVEAQVKVDKLSDTSTLPAPPEENPDDTPTAFFIVNGTEVFPLDRPVLNIGRRPDNQLVIDDPRVSRVHAQLRAIRGRYVIFDLDSTGGTFVNNQPIRQSVLYSGDVVSLAGVPLVFGQEGADSSQTQPLPAD
jgi:hypothetical protein